MDYLKSFTGMASEHSEEQKQRMYDQLSEEDKHKQTYTEWAKEAYHDQYEKWAPWLEDQYLKWFSKDNKASYATKDTLNKTKVTGISQVDNLQDDVHNLVGNQVGQGGLFRPIGDLLSKEGINRAERKGKDESGSYGGPLSSLIDPVVQNAQKAEQSFAGGAQSLGNTEFGGVKSVGSTVTGVGSSAFAGAKSAGGFIGGKSGWDDSVGSEKESSKGEPREAQRGAKDESRSGSGPVSGFIDPVARNNQKAVHFLGVCEQNIGSPEAGAQSVGISAASGVKSAGGYLGGMLGGRGEKK